MKKVQQLVARMQEALPDLQRWIDHTIEAHAAQAQPLTSLGYNEQLKCFDPDLLHSSHCVIVQSVPLPPLRELGFGDLAMLEPGEAAGITYRSTFFVREGQLSASLVFHELVHVIQWATLGAERFLLAYGVGLALAGYRDSPLEQMAYDLQERFDGGEDMSGVEPYVEKQCGFMWNDLSARLGLDPGRDPSGPTP